MEGKTMKKTVKQEMIWNFNFVKHRLEKGHDDVPLYLSGTAKKRSMITKIISEFEDDAKFDYELGVISKEAYEIEMKTVQILKNSLANYALF